MNDDTTAPEGEAEAQAAPAYFDHYWAGPRAAIDAATEDQLNTIGPLTLDGITYVAIRAEVRLPTPAALTDRPQHGRALLGVWSD